MREPMNIANSIMIIAGIYLLIKAINGWLIAVGIVLIIFGLATWGYWSFTDGHKELLRKQIEETEARIKNTNANTTFITAQAALTLRGIKNV